jgi:transposase, IS5 family
MYFGMKLHLGMDSKTELIHTMTTAAPSAHDATVLRELLHGDEMWVYGDRSRGPDRARLANKARQR